jgi:ParB-like chromosome segregation protein Spo0J
MAKLQTPTTAGFNAGKKNDVKLFPIKDIIIDPEIAGIFKISNKYLNKIQERIEKYGYNEEEPVVLWKGTNILVDGRTRYTASKNANLEKIPVFEKEFEDRQAAIMYTFQRQALRRNLTGAEIMTAVQTIKGRKENDGLGRAAEILAEELGISPATVYQARAILKDASPKDLKEVKEGKKSIKKKYNEIKDRQRPEKEFIVNDAQSLPGNVEFLRGAVIHLVEKGSTNEPITHLGAAELLINHFLRKNEKAGFYKLLPEKIVKQLPRLPLLGGIAKTSN